MIEYKIRYKLQNKEGNIAYIEAENEDGWATVRIERIGNVPVIRCFDSSDEMNDNLLYQLKRFLTEGYKVISIKYVDSIKCI